MTEKDMLSDFLNWESEPTKKPSFTDTPASELNIIPKPRADEKPPATYKTPDRPEPLSPQRPEIPYQEVEAPIRISPIMPEHRALDQLTEKYKDLFNGTITQVKDLTAEDLQKIIHGMDEKIEMIKVQKWAARITYEGKVQLEDEKVRKKLKEADSAFYVPRREKGAAKSAASPARAEKQALTKMEAGIKQLVRLKMDEATIRKTLTDSGSPVPENLTAIISQFQLTGK
jgi:hypothetical protein